MSYRNMSQKIYTFCDKKVVVSMTNESSKQALGIWTAMPADIRAKIISNVFCGQCRGVVTIADYSVELVMPDVVLR